MANFKHSKIHILVIITLSFSLALLWSWRRTGALSTNSPSLNEVENWQTYTDNELGFTIKYPSGWPNPEKFSYSTTKEIRFKNLSITTGVFYDQEKQRELSYTEVAERSSNGKEPVRLTIDGYPAIRVNIKEEGLAKPSPYSLVVIQKGGRIYQIYSSFPVENEFPEEYQLRQEIFEQILNSFRFNG